MTKVAIVGDGSHPASFSQSYGVASAIVAENPDQLSYVGDIYPQGHRYCYEFGSTGASGGSHGYDFVFGPRRADGHNLNPITASIPGNHERETVQGGDALPAGFHSGDCPSGRAGGFEYYWGRPATNQVMGSTGSVGTIGTTLPSNRVADGGSKTKIRSTFDDGTAIPDGTATVDNNLATQARGDYYWDINGVRHVYIDTSQMAKDAAPGCWAHTDEGAFPKPTDTGAKGKRWADVTGWINGAQGNACIIYAHHTPFSCGDQTAHPSGTNHTGLISLWQFCQGKVVMWVHGHWHSAWRTAYPFDANGNKAAMTTNNDGSITSDGIWLVCNGNGGNTFNPNLYTGAPNLASGVFPANSTYCDYSTATVYGYSTLVYTSNTRITFRAYSRGTSGTAPATQLGSTLVIGTTASGGGTDTSAPTAPTAVHTTAVTSSSVALAWTASSDVNDPATAITYQVLRNGVVVGTTAAGATSFTDTGVLASTTYNYTVKALDPAGNVSGASAPLAVTTSVPSGDTTPPSVPANVHTTAVTQASVALAWNASTDNVGGSGMARYRIYKDGTFLAAVTAPAVAYTDNAVSANHTYSYTVSAVDQAGNESAQSTPLSVTTPAVSTGASMLYGASGPIFTQNEITNEETAIGRHIYFAQELYDWGDAVPSYTAAGNPDNWLGNRNPITYPILDILGRLLPAQSNFPGAAAAAGGTFNDTTMTDIGNGVYDAKLVAWRNYLATLPFIHFIRPWREMTNGVQKCAWRTSTGAPYIAAWRRMYTIITGTSADYTAYNTNVNSAHPITAAANPSKNTQAMWCPAVWAGDYRGWFPGAAYVDVAGIDGYAWASPGGGGNANGPAGTGGWHSFNEIFATFYGQFNRTSGTIAKLPIIIAEMNAQEDQTTPANSAAGGIYDRAAWWNQAAAQIDAYPDILGISVWTSGTDLPGSNAVHGRAAYISFGNDPSLQATSYSGTGNPNPPVAPQNAGGAALPTISDTTPAVGQLLTATAGTWTGTAPIGYAGQWQRSSNGGSTWTTITSGLSTTQFPNDSVTVQSAWSGQILRCIVTATNAAGSASATSAATGAVQTVGTAPANAGGAAAPTITDTSPQVGETVQGTSGTWTGTTPISYVGSWQVATSASGPWTPGSGALRTTAFQNDTYVIPQAEFGMYLQFSVSALNSIGTGGPAVSAPTNAIGQGPVNDVPPTITAPHDPPQVGDTVTATTGTWH